MKISTKGRYTLRMLLDLAEHKNEGFISLKDISERQNISKKYLEQLVTLLSRPEILRTNRGNKGGYMLAKEPSQYTVGQILRITEGGLTPVSCMEDTPNRCERRGYCKTLPIWQELEKIINNYLDSITLEDALDNFKDANNSEYYI
ncbi:MAG: Rrf2 family transcriptional regulator [Treponema sp.]|nr:Rrf2 family transcriptional regulator [Treponema sp.]